MIILAVILLALIFLMTLAIFSILKEIKDTNELLNNHKINLLTSIQKALEDVHFSTMDVKEGIQNINFALSSAAPKVDSRLSSLEVAVEAIAAHPAFSVAREDHWSDSIP